MLALCNIGGDPPANQRSFTIRRNGRCNEWDGDWPGPEGAGIVKVICSEERARVTGEEWITEGEIFTLLKKITYAYGTRVDIFRICRKFFQSVIYLALTIRAEADHFRFVPAVARPASRRSFRSLPAEEAKRS